MVAGMSRHQSVTTVAAFDLSGHPGMTGLSCGLVALVRYDFLANSESQLLKRNGATDSFIIPSAAPQINLNLKNQEADFSVCWYLWNTS